MSATGVSATPIANEQHQLRLRMMKNNSFRKNIDRKPEKHEEKIIRKTKK